MKKRGVLKMAALWALLALLMVGPLLLGKMQAGYGVERIFTESAEPVWLAARQEADYDPWGNLIFMQRSTVVAETAAQVEFVMELEEGLADSAQNAVATQLKAHLEKLWKNGALPELDLNRPVMVSYSRKVYAGNGQGMDMPVSVWNVELEGAGVSVFAVMDTRAAFLYEVRVRAEEAALPDPDDAARGLMNALKEDYPIRSCREDQVTVRTSVKENEIWLKLVAAEK